jgi:hypothetical protein
VIHIASEEIFDQLHNGSKIEPFVAGQLPPETLTFTLNVGRRPAGVRGDVYAQIFSEFYLFYLE